MIKLDGQKGNLDEESKFGWVLINKERTVVKKLQGIASNGTLSYKALPINARLIGTLFTFSLK